MPRHTPEELAEFMRVDDAQSLEDYLRRFDVTISVMQSEKRSSASLTNWSRIAPRTACATSR